MARYKTPKRPNLWDTLKGNGSLIIAGLLFVTLIVGFIGLHGLHAANTIDAGVSASPNPIGTQTSSTQVAENWTLAQGLPQRKVTRFTFSVKTPTLGYAAALISPTSQAIYKTIDAGTTWQQISTVKTSIGDYLSSNPTDPRDIVLLSGAVPNPGTYTVQRSYDGGITWNPQSTNLTSDAAVSQIGWQGSTFIVGFELAVQQPGHSAVVAFPQKANSVHLDVNGTLNGMTIPHLQLIVGVHGKVQIWGTTDDKPSHTIGVATADMGNHWITISDSTSTATPSPIVATDDGNALFYASPDRNSFEISTDGGDTESPPSSNGFPQKVHSILFSPNGKFYAVEGSDGMYLFQNNKWQKVTNGPIALLAENTSSHPRLWSYDASGQMVWMDI